MIFRSNELGIVAIGRNEGTRLLDCLASLKLKGCHIIYVDSGSTDGSVVAARELGVHVVTLDGRSPFTAARARNAGFAALKEINPFATFVQFIDADCTLVGDWLETAVPFMNSRQDVAIVCGRRRERHPRASIYNTLADQEWDTPHGDTMACGGDALMRREAFEAVNGFRSTLIAGEEPELCIRLREIGWKIWRLDSDMTVHDLAMFRFGQWWRRMERAGNGMTEVWWLHRRSPAGIWGRETASAAFWGLILPVFVVAVAVVHPVFIAAAAVYPLQVARIALKQRYSSNVPVAYALLTVLGKFAACQGLLRFFWLRLRGEKPRLIEYK